MSLSDYEILDEFSFRGRWWLPNNPTDSIPGTLTFSDGRIELELDSLFSVPELEFQTLMSSPGIFKADAIYGQTTEGDPCTVLRTAAFGIGQGGLNLGEMLSSWVLIGRKKRVSKFKRSISDLLTWMNGHTNNSSSKALA